MPEKLTNQESYAFLVKNAYCPHFFHKLSSYGLSPASEDEATQFLSLAGKLRRAELENNVKTAGQRTSVLVEAHRDLDRVLGVPASNVSPQDNALIKQSAANLAQNQEMRDAALTYQSFLAELSKQA